MCTPNTDPRNLQGLINSLSLSLVLPESTYYTFCHDYSPTHTWIDLFLVGDFSTVFALRNSESPLMAGYYFIEISCNCLKVSYFCNVTRSYYLKNFTADVLATSMFLNFASIVASIMGSSTRLTTHSPPVTNIETELVCIDTSEHSLTLTLIITYNSVALIN